MKPAPFDYHAATSVEEAISLLDRYGGEARLLAGGQSLVPLLNMRILRPAAVVDINRIPGLAEIRVEDGVVRIGALVRHAQIERSPLVARHLPLLAEAIRYVGDRQVRSRGTLAGSLAQADPAGEMPVAALALGATVVVQGPGGTRHLPVKELFLGPYTTALEPNEMIVSVVFPDSANTVCAVAEYARRHNDFAVVSVMAVGVPGPDGRWESIRLSLGGVADRPIIVAAATDCLSGTRLEPEAVQRAVAACLEAANPSSDVRASAEYRRHLIPIYVERVLEELSQRRAGGVR